MWKNAIFRQNLNYTSLKYLYNLELKFWGC